MSPDANPTLEEDRAALAEMRDLGVAMARLVVARAEADAANDVDTDHTPAFERVNRGVRRAVFLLQHIAETLAKARHAATRSNQHRVHARRIVIRDVEDAACRRPKPEQDALAAELVERLDRPEFDDDLSGMTIAEASKLIRRDFGLGEIFAHKRRTPADVDELATRARHSADAAAPRQDAALPAAPPPPFRPEAGARDLR